MRIRYYFKLQYKLKELVSMIWTWWGFSTLPPLFQQKQQRILYKTYSVIPQLRFASIAWFCISMATPPITTNQMKLQRMGRMNPNSTTFLIVRPLLILVANMATNGAHPSHQPPKFCEKRKHIFLRFVTGSPLSKSKVSVIRKSFLILIFIILQYTVFKIPMGVYLSIFYFLTNELSYGERDRGVKLSRFFSTGAGSLSGRVLCVEFNDLIHRAEEIMFPIHNCPPPAVCVNAWMGFFDCVNAWKSKKNCVNAWIEKTCVNVKINFSFAWMRESALLLAWIFPFHPNLCKFPWFSTIFPIFPKFSPISRKIGFAWISRKNLRECVNFENFLRECVNFGSAGGLIIPFHFISNT